MEHPSPSKGVTMSAKLGIVDKTQELANALEEIWKQKAMTWRPRSSPGRIPNHAYQQYVPKMVPTSRRDDTS